MEEGTRRRGPTHQGIDQDVRVLSFFTDLAYLPSAVNAEEVKAFPVPHCGILSLRGHSSCCKYAHSYAPSLYIRA